MDLWSQSGQERLIEKTPWNVVHMGDWGAFRAIDGVSWYCESTEGAVLVFSGSTPGTAVAAWGWFDHWLILHVILDVSSQISHISGEGLPFTQGFIPFYCASHASLYFIFQMGTARVAQRPCLLCWPQYQDHHLGTSSSSRVRPGPTSPETLELAPRVTQWLLHH